MFKDVKKIYGSGRTDTGVHAEGQIVHFDTNKIFESKTVIAGINAKLAKDLKVIACERVDSQFDARRSATSREYNYLFSSDEIPHYLIDFVTAIRFQPNEMLLNSLRDVIEGTHDFKRFRNVGSTENGTERTVFHFSITKHPFPCVYEWNPTGYYYRIRIVANGFLYRMVRNITGGVFEVLRGRQSIDTLRQYLNGDAVSFKYTTAPAKGLSLVKVNYE